VSSACGRSCASCRRLAMTCTRRAPFETAAAVGCESHHVWSSGRSWLLVLRGTAGHGLNRGQYNTAACGP
jgi:hypothetical protein